MTWMLLFLLASTPLVKVETVLEYEFPPGGIHEIDDMIMTSDGRLYALEIPSGQVHIWGKDGKFIKSFGRKGTGPGEFDFNPDFHSFYNISYFQGHIMVMNGVTRIFSLFDHEGTFIKAEKLAVDHAVFYIEATKGNNLITKQMDYFKEQVVNIDLFASDLNRLKQVTSYKMQVMVPQFRAGAFSHYVINPFAPSTVIFANPGFDGFILGENHGPEFDIYDNLGNKVKKVRWKLPRPEVFPDFLAQAKEIANKSKAKNNQFRFSAEMPYYDIIIALKDGMYFVGYQSPDRSIYRGHLVDDHGNVLGRVEYTIGQDGYMDALQSKLIVCSMNEDDELGLKEVSFSP